MPKRSSKKMDMTQRNDAKALASKNPMVNQELLEKAQEAIRALRAHGVKPRRYSLEQGYSRRGTKSASDDDDPRSAFIKE